MWGFNIFKVVQMFIPVSLRWPRMKAWVKVFVSDLVVVLYDLNQLRMTSIKEARMTGQICYLEHYLNERYGTGTQIYIGDGYLLGPWCWFSGPPAGEVDMYMVEPDNYCYSESSISDVDFVVMVPYDLEDETSMIGAYVQKFKDAGFYFLIQLY